MLKNLRNTELVNSLQIYIMSFYIILRDSITTFPQVYDRIKEASLNWHFITVELFCVGKASIILNEVIHQWRIIKIYVSICDSE